MSSGVCAIFDVATSILTHKRSSYYSEHPSAPSRACLCEVSTGLSAFRLTLDGLGLIDCTNKQIKYPPDAQFNGSIPATTAMARKTSTRSTSTPALALLLPKKLPRSAPEHGARPYS